MWAVVTVAVVAASGCTEPRRPREDGRIPVALPANGAVRSLHPSLVLPPAAARELVAKALDSSARFVVAASDYEDIAARMTFSVSDASLGFEPLGGDEGISLELRLEYSPPLSAEDELIVVSVSGEGTEATQTFEAALDSALDELHGRIRERARTSEELVADLSATDPQRRLAALDELAGRRHPAAIPGLWELLETGDDILAAGALTRLVAFSPPGLARRIINQSEKRGFAFLLQAVHALGAVGGEESFAYLYLLESGHPDPRVLAAARGALDSLERRRAVVGLENATSSDEGIEEEAAEANGSDRYDVVGDPHAFDGDEALDGDDLASGQGSRFERDFEGQLSSESGAAR